MKQEFEVFKLNGKATVEQIIKDLTEQSDILNGGRRSLWLCKWSNEWGSIDADYKTFIGGVTIIVITL